MTIPTISTLPVAPARTDAPATFITRADAFLAAIVTMQSELNTSIGAMNTDIAGVNADATAAAASASAAATSESNASTSETNAATSETNAASSAAAAASSYDQFDDRYLGSKASDPAVDNDGNALLTGALYFNSTSDDMKVYTGSTWKVTGFNPDSPTFTDTVTAPSFDINSIAETKAEAAVDVFVYDTRKDSDGGAWRKRTQHTSWYNETLNTATRGSRKEFPAVAVIVCKSDNTLVIYDGDDPDLPMWMVFNISSGYVLHVYGASGVTMLNGIMSVSDQDLGGGLNKISFIKDMNEYYLATIYRHGGNLAERNTNYSYVNSGENSIVNSNVNDVAMTVLPNAPIDAATGLPVPTIAVATEGGISVIKDDGSVYDLAPTNSPAAHIIDFHDDYIYVSTDIGGYDANTIYKFSIPSSDQTNSFYSQMPSYIAGFNNLRAGTHVGNQGNGLVNGSAYGSSLHGLGLLSEDTTTPANSSMAYITSTYNTGWMNGDIKLATLSDTTAGTVPTTDFVVNGTFATDTGWIKQSGWTIGSGVASCDGTNGTYLYQLSGLPANTQVVASIEITSYTSGSIRIGSAGVSTETVLDSVGTHSVSFTTNNSGGGAEILSVSFVGSIDNVSITAAVEDRSVNDNGLQVFGTITKTPVATGADLVAYSGFSVSNYLEQPTNTDIISLSSYCFIGWVKTTVTGTNQYLFSIGTLGINSAGIALNTSGVIYVYDPVNGVDMGNANIGNSVWHQVVLTYDGSTKKIYIDGKLDSSFSVSTYSFLSTDTYKAGTYCSTSFVNIMQGSISLQRLSATIPTAEQIAKIYEDEKYLFQENAQATLYGSSDAVTALAYDGDTELLHVGTSAGRSVFSGLRRVDNTTGAVGAAISASNGLVAED